MKKINKLFSIVLAITITLSCLFAMSTSAETATTRTVSKEVTLYSWDLTKPSTFWSVTGGTSNPVNQTSGSDANAEFRIDENGAYILGKNYWPAFNTTGAANNVDLSNATTKLVVEFETQAAATVFVKASFDSTKPDDKATLFEKTVTGFYRFEKNISSTSSTFASLQLGLWAGGAVTFKTAKIVKVVSGPRIDETGATQKIIKNYSLADTSEMEIHSAANPVFGENGLTMTASASWVGLNTTAYQLNVADPSTKLVLDISNPEGATVAIKYVTDNVYSAEKAACLGGEIALISNEGVMEFYLDKVLTKDEMIAVSKGKIRFQLLLGSTNKTVTVHSMKLVKTTVAIFNKSINLSNTKNFWNMQGFPTSENYANNGTTMPLSGTTDTGSYALNPENGTLSITAADYNGSFWYGAALNSVKIDLNRNPKLKFTVVSSGNRWTLKVGVGDNYSLNLFNEYGNSVTSGNVCINLANYSESLLPAATSSKGVFNMGMNFMVLTNGDNLPTVVKDLRIEYENPDPLENVTAVTSVEINTDTSEPAVLPSYLTLTTENYTDTVNVAWNAPENYDAQVAGKYTFSGTLNAEELANKGFINQQPITATVNVKQLIIGDVNDDGIVDVKDLIRLKKYIALVENTVIYENAAKLDADAEINGQDLAALRIILMEAI